MYNLTGVTENHGGSTVYHPWRGSYINIYIYFTVINQQQCIRLDNKVGLYKSVLLLHPKTESQVAELLSEMRKLIYKGLFLPAEVTLIEILAQQIGNVRLPPTVGSRIWLHTILLQGHKKSSVLSQTETV